MPLYEFECKDCQTVTEKLINHSASEDEKEYQDCSYCGEVAKRRISLGSFSLVGDWFKNNGKY